MLALIAGTGDLPTAVAARLRKWPLVVGLHGTQPDELIPEITFRLETLGTLLQQLAQAGVHEVCFAGGIRRPAVDVSKIDAATAPLVPRMMQALGQGDDAALRIVIEIFQDAGFSVLGVDEIVIDFLLPFGSATPNQPSQADHADILRGFEILSHMSPLDIGQACVVAGKQTIAIEAVGGTDWMLRSLLIPGEDGPIRDPHLPKGGVLVKAPKAGQDRRIDLPTIGPETMQVAALAGLKGVAIQEGGTMVLHPEQTLNIANSLGLFLYVAEAPK